MRRPLTDRPIDLLMTNNQHALLLCGGEINHANLPIGTNRSNAMVPVNGKPVIGWILDTLQERGFAQVTVVLRVENMRLRDFIEWAYRGRMSVTLAYVDKGGTILHSLMSGLNQVGEADRLHLILGDTLVRDEDVMLEQDYVYVGPYDVSENWCLVQAEPNGGEVTAYYDKETKVPAGLQALVGYYHFVDSGLLKNLTAQAIAEGGRELSAVLKSYGNQRAIVVRPVKDWLDFGHINPFLEAKRKLLQTRFFNSLSIDSTKGTLTKRSEKNDKLLDELNWYRKLPPSLQVLAPRVLEESEDETGKVCIVQEYYGYPNLAELYVFGDLDNEIWHTTLHALLEVAKLFQGEQAPVSAGHVQAMYGDKTWERLNMLREQDAEQWGPLLDAATLTINGVKYPNVLPQQAAINQRVAALAANVQGGVLHGDYCFSNILYDVTSQIIRVIDPRGSFGEPGIYGDPRYDLAKLRHSICGKYDFLIAGLFTTQQEGPTTYRYTIFGNERSEELGHYFDEALMSHGASLAEIRFIEALLFISMVPYHAGHPERQQVMYLQGVKFLHESLQMG